MADDLNEMTGLSEDKLYAATAYLFILVLVPLLTKKDNPEINFHVRQGLLLSVALVMALIAGAWSGPLGGILFVLVMIANLVALVMALQGRRWKVPVIGNLAEKIRI